MKAAISIVATAVVLMLAHVVSSWWGWVMVLPFMLGVVMGFRVWRTAWTMAISAALVWGAQSVFWTLNGSDLIVAQIAETMSLPAGAWLIVVTTLVGAIAAGLAGATGSSLRRIKQAKAH